MARTFNFFEKIILVIGIIIVVLGYFMIQKAFVASGNVTTWDSVSTVFLWIMVILLLIILAANENVKEELKGIAINQMRELKLIKQELRYLQTSRKK